MTLAAGQTLTHYEILGPLGAGAMGEVYRARDTRLEREVAIKVLPVELAGDEERLRRFEREAKALASLSHPNVAQVFGIDQVADTCFMAMELVPGEDLAARLSRGALQFDETLEVCRQIAEGIEAAHEAGVIHRDLKPANVVITPENRVKVLDFGVAKPAVTGPPNGTKTDSVLTNGGRPGCSERRLTWHPSRRGASRLTSESTCGGSAASLYECLTGQRAFDGETTGDVLAAVLEKEPDWSVLPASTPAHVRALLERCLDKDTRTRLRDIGEARVVLGSEPASPEKPAAIQGGVIIAMIVGVAVVAAVAAIVSGIWRQAPPVHWSPLAGTTPRKLTEWPGTEFDAAISRDGKLFAFVSDRDGQLDAWVGLIDGGTPRNLTRGGRKEWSLRVRDVYFDLELRAYAWQGGARSRGRDTSTS